MKNVCSEFFDHVGKRLDKRAKVNFKYISSHNKYYNFYIVQYPKK